MYGVRSLGTAYQWRTTYSIRAKENEGNWFEAWGSASAGGEFGGRRVQRHKLKKALTADYEWLECRAGGGWCLVGVWPGLCWPGPGSGAALALAWLVNGIGIQCWHGASRNVNNWGWATSNTQVAVGSKPNSASALRSLPKC